MVRLGTEVIAGVGVTNLTMNVNIAFFLALGIRTTAMISRAITLVTTSALQGAGDTKFPMYSSLVGIWGIRVVGVYILSIRLGYGLVGVWTA